MFESNRQTFLATACARVAGCATSERAVGAVTPPGSTNGVAGPNPPVGPLAVSGGEIDVAAFSGSTRETAVNVAGSIVRDPLAGRELAGPGAATRAGAEGGRGHESGNGDDGPGPHGAWPAYPALSSASRRPGWWDMVSCIGCAP